MPLRRPAWAGMLLSLMAAAALAQSPPPPPEDDPMARARRQAENPLRRIVEAGRITVRRAAAPAGPDAGAAPATGDAVRPAAATPVQPPVAPGRVPGSAGTAPGAGPAAAIRVTVEPLRPATDAAAAAESPAVLPAPGRAAALAPPPSQPDPGLMPAAPPPPVAADALPNRDASTEAAPAAEAVAAVAPQLRTLVEPALTPRLRDELGRVDVVAVDLQVGTDGSVQDAQVQTRVTAAVRRSIVAALRQWRYEPVAEPTWLRVEVVFER